MSKQALGPVNAMYPSLTTIVGAMVRGRPNWNAIAHVGIMNHGSPQYISVGMRKTHYTYEGILEHREFSVNLPSAAMMAQADHVGLVSGKTMDKSGLFETFPGELANAPLIKGCPAAMECRLDRIVDFELHGVLVGEIVQTWADEEVLEEGKIHFGRVQPILFDFQRVRYWSLGQELGRPWHEGKALKRAD